MSALSTCGALGNPLDLVPDLPTCPGAASSSSFPFAHTHDDGGSLKMGGCRLHLHIDVDVV